MSSKRGSGALAFLGYFAISFLYFGIHVVRHPGREILGYGPDPDIFLWSFAWWPHALAHGLNPFLTDRIWAPDGFNLAWTASAPGLALLFTPVTIAAGPVVAYNAAEVLLPALAAWSAFLLCRHMTRSLWPSLAGGYLFGFSTYVLAQELGHPHLTAIFPVPLVALAILRYVEDEIGPRGLVLRVAPLLALQLTFSTELSFMLVLCLAGALAIAWFTWRDVRTQLRALARPLVASYALAGVITSPLLYYVAKGAGSGSLAPKDNVSDVVNLFVPTELMYFSGRVAYSLQDHFPGNLTQRDAYLGLPTLLVIAWFARRRWRTPSARFLVYSLALGFVLSLGTWVHVVGVRVLPLPWLAVTNAPLFDSIVPARFALFVALAAAVIVAIWAASAGPLWLRAGVPLVCAIALFPDPTVHDYWHTTPNVPRFFTDAAYRSCLAPNEIVLALPYGSEGDSMLWQARDGFRFRQAGGYISYVQPAAFTRFAAVRALIEAQPPPAGSLAAFLRAEGVGAVVVDQAAASPWASYVTGLGSPSRVGGVLLYRVRSASLENCPRE